MNTTYSFNFITKIIIVVLIFSNSVFIHGQESINTKEIKPFVTPEDYGKWESKLRNGISSDGNFISYQISTMDEDQSTYLYSIINEKLSTFKNTSRAVFSNDSNWLALDIVPTGKETRANDKLKEKPKTPPKQKSLIINTSTLDSITIEDVNSLSFSPKHSFIAIKRQKEKVKSLVVRNLNTGDEVSFGNIKAFEWQPKGVLLAMVIENEGNIGNAIHLYNPLTGNIKVLDHKDVPYTRMQWLYDSDELYVFRTLKKETHEKESYEILIWKNLDSKKSSFHVFNQDKFDNFPDNTRVLDNQIRVSENADAIYFSTFSWTKKPVKEKVSKEEKPENTAEEKEENQPKKEYTASDEAPDLEIWHSKDEVIIPEQKQSRMQGTERIRSAVWRIKENKFIPLSGNIVEEIRIQKDNNLIVGMDVDPYGFEAMFGRKFYDIYVVNTQNGKKTKVLSKISAAYSVSKNNNFFVYLTNDNLFLYDIKTRHSTNITKNLKGQFIDFDDDHPLPQKNAYGFADWSADGNSFFIYGKYDIWQVFTNGKAPRRITNGAKEQIRYRFYKMDNTQKGIDTKQAQYFSIKGLWSKKSGYAYGVPGKKLTTLIFEDANIEGLRKAKNNDQYIFTKGSFTQSPNLFLTNSKFKKLEQISDTNPFQKDYAWGKSSLVTFKNVNGKPAQGILYYPANYEKGKKYPMITYIYEKLSQGIHQYKIPMSTDYYSTAVWTQNGYFVLHPDIDFTPSDPGISSARTLENAVAAVVNLGDVDAKKVGLIGHSWGGYQAGYVPTQTDIFAASVAGAGLTNFISMNLAITPGFGGKPENDHFEVGQERMVSPPWEIPENYLRNSSVMNVHKLNTPILFEVGDNDQNVDWRQGIEYYNAARRANKPFVLLVYANEGHGLRYDKNTKDYQQRILKWFGHYLKGEPAEDWIKDGIPYTEQQRRLKNWNDK